MPNGDFHSMSDRELLVKMATQFDYIEKRIEFLNRDVSNHIEALRITINDCNEDHCEVENKLNKRLSDVEKKMWNITAIAGSILFILTFLKEELIRIIFGR